MHVEWKHPVAASGVSMAGVGKLLSRAGESMVTWVELVTLCHAVAQVLKGQQGPI